jgi:hypothetical protein
MDTKRDDDQYSDEEATRRMNDALQRALNTPPKPQATIRHSRRKQAKAEGERPPAKPRTSARSIQAKSPAA